MCVYIGIGECRDASLHLQTYMVDLGGSQELCLALHVFLINPP